jgi:hypothetical protein
MLAVLLAGSGATCHRSMVYPFAAAGPTPPQVLFDGASREQIVAAVNQNSARIQSLSVSGAAITIPGTLGLPILNGNIAAERPRRFRLTAGTAVSGPEIDIGSNDELFWVWVARNRPPAIYFCRHSQFATSNIRQMMPVEPSWLLAALGMVEIDPASVFDGPVPRPDGKVELRTWMASASGALQRVLVIDARSAQVTEQYIYEPNGTLVASAIAESHRYDEAAQVTLPQRLSIELPTANLRFKIDLGAVAVNRLPGDPQQLWTMPTYQGYPLIDLGGAANGTPLPGQLPAVQSPALTSQPPIGTVPTVRRY